MRASAVRRAQALTLAVPPASGGLDVSDAVADGEVDGVLEAVGVPDGVVVSEAAALLGLEGAEPLSSGASPPPQAAASAPTRASATAAVRRGRTRAVEREVTPRR
ncbi:hypothetical protein ASG74_03420 [Knoellia sp. Soil729]|nr:hypothetical protein ASG74_03420 [Knoellia sp. Soil729]